MRQCYLLFEKVAALRQYFGNFTWTHDKYLLPIDDTRKITYYISIAVSQNLYSRELEKRIKSNEYERIEYKEEL